MEKTEAKTFNLPELKKVTGGVAKKSATTAKTIQPLDLKAAVKASKVDAIISGESFKAQMNKYQQAHKGLDLVLMGDLTGSMGAYHALLKRKCKELCSVLFPLIPNLRIGIIFYLDHGSGDPYITKVQPLTTDVQELQHFIDTTCTGYGGDADEAVEDALHDALHINWGQNNAHSIVLFGDACPHEPQQCPYQYDYFVITKQLYEKQVTVNTVFCGGGYSYKDIPKVYEVDIGDFSSHRPRGEAAFFSWLANITGGVAIGVEQIDDLVDIISAMAAKDAGKLDEFEEETKRISAKPIPALQHIKERAKQIEVQKKRLLLGYSA